MDGACGGGFALGVTDVTLVRACCILGQWEDLKHTVLHLQQSRYAAFHHVYNHFRTTAGAGIDFPMKIDQ